MNDIFDLINASDLDLSDLGEATNEPTPDDYAPPEEETAELEPVDEPQQQPHIGLTVAFVVPMEESEGDLETDIFEFFMGLSDATKEGADDEVLPNGMPAVTDFQDQVRTCMTGELIQAMFLNNSPFKYLFAQGMNTRDQLRIFVYTILTGMFRTLNSVNNDAALAPVMREMRRRNIQEDWTYSCGLDENAMPVNDGKIHVHQHVEDAMRKAIASGPDLDKMFSEREQWFIGQLESMITDLWLTDFGMTLHPSVDITNLRKPCAIIASVAYATYVWADRKVHGEDL